MGVTHKIVDGNVDFCSLRTNAPCVHPLVDEFMHIKRGVNGSGGEFYGAGSGFSIASSAGDHDSPHLIADAKHETALPSSLFSAFSKSV